jgi:hypothetical protein
MFMENRRASPRTRMLRQELAESRIFDSPHQVQPAVPIIKGRLQKGGIGVPLAHLLDKVLGG